MFCDYDSYLQPASIGEWFKENDSDEFFHVHISVQAENTSLLPFWIAIKHFWEIRIIFAINQFQTIQRLHLWKIFLIKKIYLFINFLKFPLLNDPHTREGFKCFHLEHWHHKTFQFLLFLVLCQTKLSLIKKQYT